VAEHFFIRPSDGTDQAAVVALNANGHLIGAPETIPLSVAAARAGDMPITVLLPARDLVSCLASVPAASPGRLRQMLPFSLEDELAGDIEDLHFAAGERNDNDALAVSVIARDRLAYWLAALRSAGIEPRRICSEADGVPDTPGVVTLFMEGRQILGRRPGGAPFLFEEIGLTEIWHLLETERAESDDLGQAVLFVDRRTHDERREEIERWREGVAEVNVRELADGCLPKLASTLVFRGGANLLQGGFATQSNLLALARPWRVAAVFALAFVGVSVLGTGAEYYKLNSEEDRLAVEATQICADRYGTPQLSRCLAEMARRLSDAGQGVTGGGGQGFLGMLGAIAESAGDAMTITGISYRDRVMTLEVLVPNASYLEAFGQRLGAGAAYAHEVQNSVSQPDGGLQSRVRVVATSP
jgi:general secretion pathway protein L